jgi:hypothetical protein
MHTGWCSSCLVDVASSLCATACCSGGANHSGCAGAAGDIARTHTRKRNAHRAGHTTSSAGGACPSRGTVHAYTTAGG